MEKIIEFEINNKNDFYDKYNSKKVSKELVNYLVENTPRFSNNDQIKVLYKNNTKDELDIERMIKEELNQCYKNNLHRHHRNDYTQAIYLIIGLAGILLSTIINNSLLEEIAMIGGTVFIMALIEMEIYTEVKEKRRRKIIDKLLKSKFEGLK